MFKPKIKVIGIGGAGCNTISRIASNSLKGIEFFSVNTDAQALRNNFSPNKILIGEKITGGLGTGMDWKLGLRAVRESEENLKEVLKGAEIVFLTCGLGGGSGTPAVSVLGEISKRMGILTLAVVTLPFSFEGDLRRRVAKLGLENLKKNVDAFLTIPNDRVLKISGKTTSVEEAFLKVDKILVEALEGVFNLLSLSGIISIDFADLEEILKNSGKVLLGIGKAEGVGRALSAASRALRSPLLDFLPKKAKGILFAVSGRDVALFEVNLIANFIKKIADQKTKIIFGVSEDRTLKKGEIKVNLIATGVE